MSESRERGEASRSADGVARERRYVAVETINDDLLIYDRQRTDAWIQSDLAVEVDAVV